MPAATFVLGGVGDEALVTEGLSGKLRTENLVLPGWVRGEEKEKLYQNNPSAVDRGLKKAMEVLK